jgi:hypothetical protein
MLFEEMVVSFHLVAHLCLAKKDHHQHRVLMSLSRVIFQKFYVLSCFIHQTTNSDLFLDAFHFDVIDGLRIDPDYLAHHERRMKWWSDLNL